MRLIRVMLYSYATAFPQKILQLQIILTCNSSMDLLLANGKNTITYIKDEILNLFSIKANKSKFLMNKKYNKNINIVFLTLKKVILYNVINSHSHLKILNTW